MVNCFPQLQQFQQFAECELGWLRQLQQQQQCDEFECGSAGALYIVPGLLQVPGFVMGEIEDKDYPWAVALNK